jgi:hypothetical protein
LYDELDNKKTLFLNCVESRKKGGGIRGRGKKRGKGEGVWGGEGGEGEGEGGLAFPLRRISPTCFSGISNFKFHCMTLPFMYVGCCIVKKIYFS